MWNMECFFIPAIIGATGIITKGVKYLEIIPENSSAYSLQKKKSAVLGTSNVIREVLQSGT
jgi:hypothetical protein